VLVCFLFVGCYLLLQTISFRESRRYYFAGHFLRPNCAVVAAKSLPKPPRHRAARLSECTADRPSEQAYEHEASLHTYTYTKLGESGHYYTHVPSRYVSWLHRNPLGRQRHGRNTPTTQDKSGNLATKAEEGRRTTTNDQRPTTNDQRPTTNDQRPTTNEQRPTTNDQRPTNNKQRTMNDGDERRTTNADIVHQTNAEHQTTNTEHHFYYEKYSTRVQQKYDLHIHNICVTICGNHSPTFEIGTL